MKKFLLTVLLLFSAYGYSQSITVSTSAHTVPQIVNEVLINSACVEATNITWSTGSNFSSSNGIGYFENTNPAFPMQAGVILSTGNAVNAQGPNMELLNDGTTQWPGDPDLENTLLQAGITMSSVNATVLEFDFVPISSHFNFNFVFASEEYGNFQCQFSDAFAFLLTNVQTGVTTNLAVVPGTSTPISVVTIRDFLYNSSCPSANVQYFGMFNGGSAAASSATNFNGQTVSLNASSVLVPNVPYHIKLVIADRGDYESDSAIFISSNSFNIGQEVLGLDLTVANNTAICFGQTHVLDTGLDPSTYTFSWKRNGNTISGATGPSINVTQPGNYSVTYYNNASGCNEVTDEIVIEYLPQITTAAPKDLYMCDNGSGMYNFDLSYNTARVSNNIVPAPTVTYHASADDANNNANILPISFPSAGGQMIFVRIQLAGSSCFTVKQFQLLVTPPLVAVQPPDLIKCARSATSNNAFFNLNLQNPIILNGQSATINIVRFFTTAEGAANNTGNIAAPNNVLVSTQTIYVRVQNLTDPSCFAITSFNVTINPLPPVDVLTDVIVCDSYVLPPLVNGNYFSETNGGGEAFFAGDLIGETQFIYIFNQPDGPNGCSAQSRFKVTVIDPLTLNPGSGTYCGSYTLPGLEYGKYHTAPAGGGVIIPAGTVLTSTQTVYIYYQTIAEPFCTIDINFTATILPAPEVGTFSNVFGCESYTLQPLSVGNYFSQPNGQGPALSAGTLINSSQTVYVFAEGSGSQECTDETQFNVVIGFEGPADVLQCNPYTLPVLPVGSYFTGPNGTGTLIEPGTAIDQSMTVHVFIPTSGTNTCTTDFSFNISISQPPVDNLPDVTVCDYYILPALTNGTYFTEPAGAGVALSAGDPISSDQIIYIYSQVVADCYNESSFEVTINPLPAIDSRSNIDACDQYVLTNLTAGNYFTGPNGTGTMLPGGTVITASQTIFIYATSAAGCTAQNSFEIFIFSVNADAPQPVTACDNYTLPALTNGLYYTMAGGPYTAGNIQKFAGDVITSSTTLFTFLEATERAISCTDEHPFLITINQTPVIPTPVNVNVCNSYTLPAITIGKYFTGAGGTGTQLPAGTILTTSQLIYIFAETATVPNCTDEESFTITIFNVDNRPDVTTCESYSLPALTNGRYYTGSGGTGTQFPVGTAITESTLLYIYSQSPFTPVCYDESSFNITIIERPVANPVPTALTTVCDEDDTNDGITVFNLTTLNATLLETQTGTEFTVTYFASMADATLGTNPITSSNLPTVYARVSNLLAPDCFDIRIISITVNKLPEPTPTDGIICFIEATQVTTNPYTIASGLSSSTHTFQWRNEDGQIIGTGSTYVANLPGIYTVTATSKATGCVSEETPVIVTPSEPAIIAYTVTQDFADSQSITVVASGTGDYVYQLDSGNFQSNPVFNNVASGLHLITVKDLNNCGETTAEALVINYPHYFTPNGDGFNDTWNIKDLEGETNAIISIFDRYGKLLGQISPNGKGWDGTFNGSSLPSTDYWFVVKYTKDDAPKEFRSHFAMKR